MYSVFNVVKLMYISVIYLEGGPQTFVDNQKLLKLKKPENPWIILYTFYYYFFYRVVFFVVFFPPSKQSIIRWRLNVNVIKTCKLTLACWTKCVFF